MSQAECLYGKLPILLQHAACSLEGWRAGYSRFGGPFCSRLEEAESRAFWSVERITAHRDERLRAFLQHCVETVPFYRRWFRSCGVSPNEIRSSQDLHRLPILTKEEVQVHCQELLSEAVSRRERIPTHTSGTTGGGLRFVTTPDALQEQWATWWRYRRWQGLERGTWSAYFGGRSVVPLDQAHPPFWRYNFPGRQILFSGYHMSPDTLGLYIEELRRSRPPWLHGYPSLLALLASALLERGVDLGYQVRWITTGAENLLPQQSELLQRAFGVRPRQHYGMAEAVANASECERGALHVDEDFAAVEFLPTTDGSGYRVIGTNFSNLAFPLVRYDVQDVVALSEVTCSCGRPGRVIARVDGRQEDYIVLSNGARLGRMDHIFKDMTSIREAQIHQRRRGEIILRVVRGASYSRVDEVALMRETQKRVGIDTAISIEYVNRLQRSASGKLRFVVSEIPDGQLQGVEAAARTGADDGWNAVLASGSSGQQAL
jgi:phenylacetate-CoA ligase